MHCNPLMTVSSTKRYEHFSMLKKTDSGSFMPSGCSLHALKKKDPVILKNLKIHATDKEKGIDCPSKLYFETVTGCISLITGNLFL